MAGLVVLHRGGQKLTLHISTSWMLNVRIFLWTTGSVGANGCILLYVRVGRALVASGHFWVDALQGLGFRV